MARGNKTVSAPKDDYMCEEDHRTLSRAEEIRSDPKRMAGVRRHHRKTEKAMRRMSRVVR